jgi:hypothetical protein
LVLDESEDDMSNQFIYSEEFDPPRIGVNCGCGVIKWFNLSPVNTDAAMVPKARTDLELPASTKFAKIVSDENQPCYAVSAVEWIFARAVDMHTFLVDAAVLGIDVLSGNIDEGLNGFVLLADLLNGANDIMDVVEVSKGQVASVFGDEDLVDLMVSHWTYDGEVTRNELDAWIEYAPSFVWGVPVRLLLYLWMVYGILSNYNQNLEMLAAECESGYSLSDGGIPGAGGELGSGGEGAIETTVEDSGTVYPVWTWLFDPDHTFYDPGDEYTLPSVGPLAAIYIEGTMTGTGTPHMSLQVDGVPLYDDMNSGEAPGRLSLLARTTQQSLVVAETLFDDPAEMTIIVTWPSGNDIASWEFNENSGGTAYYHISKIILIGEPLP